MLPHDIKCATYFVFNFILENLKILSLARNNIKSLTGLVSNPGTCMLVSGHRLIKILLTAV